MNVLRHHGIKGQRWGIRRFENEDGTLTEEGKKRYSHISYQHEYSREDGHSYNIHAYSSDGTKEGRKSVDKMSSEGKHESAMDKFDAAGKNAISAYKSDGKEAVKEVLSNELKDLKYDFALLDDKNLKSGKQSITFVLNVYGDDYLYLSNG